MTRAIKVILCAISKVKRGVALFYYFSIFDVMIFVFYKIAEKLKIRTKNKRTYTFFDSYSRPVYIRIDEPDGSNYSQIFVEKEYEGLSDLKDVRCVVDLGGYIGLSSIWFLEHFKNSSVITIEPDPQNFLTCRKNLKAYKKRCNLIRAAIWPYKTGLLIERNVYRDGKGWSAQARETKNNETPAVMAVDMPSLIDDFAITYIDILKIDIERAEIPLFNAEHLEWLDKVKNIAIELHDEECERIFFKALSVYNYQLLRSGEITICKNIQRK